MRILSIFLLMTFLVVTEVTAGVLKGNVTDKETKEPLIGATIQLEGTSAAAVADIDGSYTCKVKNGTYIVVVTYMGYVTIRQEVEVKGDTEMNFEMEADAQMLEGVTVSARRTLESERALLMERQEAVLAIENIGAREMSVKGVSNVQEGVKKITGISIASAGQLIVRGLGDRYSTTTLNGLPIASPNPDNKLVPLDLFPASTVQNITVSKVYEAGAFADYSGAHIDISTKEGSGEPFVSIGFNIGGKANTIGKDFYRSDRKGSMFSTGRLANRETIAQMGRTEFREYAQTHDIFGTSFSAKKKTSLPEFGGSIGAGNNWKIGDNNELDMLLSFGISNEQQILDDAYVTTMTAQGNHLDEFTYDRYTSKLKMAGMANLGYSIGDAHTINYTFFYARNAIDEYIDRRGIDKETNHIISSNSVFHAYSLLNNQLMGEHDLNERWTLDWSGSYGITHSDEPDRRQVIFTHPADSEELSLFRLNQTTNRYFGELKETEGAADIRATYKWNENNRVRLGAAYKNKHRDFHSLNFFYNINALDAQIGDYHNTDAYLNQDNIANGSIVMNLDAQPRYNYYAGTEIYAAFAEMDYYPMERFLINLGLRYEQAKQWVRYWTDGGQEQKSNLDKVDFFPALNLRYTLDEAQSLRFSVSRTITRPSFIEMAPFLYQESYGSGYLRGNDELRNAYNYNIDLRYDFIPTTGRGDMFSVTAYDKKLKSPIEQTQESSGGMVVRSFRNAEDGIAAGVELEFRKEIFKDLRIGANGSYMYTNVILPEGGVYTEAERELQGASPFLINADISYAPRFSETSDMTMALVYNVQGPRIETVGIYGTGDVKQQTLHTLDFVAAYNPNRNLTLSLKVQDLLNSTVRFKQDIPDTGESVEVESFRPGINASVGITYKF